MGERARLLKPNGHSDWEDVDAAGIWSEGHVPDPGKSASLPRAVVTERWRNGAQMAAEAVVIVDASMVKGRTLETTDANRSMEVERQKAA